MISPSWESSPGALAAFLNSTTQGVCCGLVTITMRDGTVHRWARGREEVTIAGDTWSPHGAGGRPLLSWTPAKTTVGLEVGDLTVTLSCGGTAADAAIGGVRLPLAAMRGAFRGARLKLERLYVGVVESGGAANELPASLPFVLDGSGDLINGAPVGTLVEFEGTIQSVKTASISVDLVVESDIAKLKMPLPRSVLSAACQNTWGDAACGVNKATYTGTGGCAAGSTKSLLVSPTGAGTGGDGYWSGAAVTMTGNVTPALAGVRRTVGAYTVGNFPLVPPLPVAPAVGDLFTVVPPCDKTPGPFGCARFANLPRFRATPILPKE